MANNWNHITLYPGTSDDVIDSIDNAELQEEIHSYLAEMTGTSVWVTVDRTDSKEYPMLTKFSNGSGCATTNGNCVWGEWCNYRHEDMLRLHDWGVNEEGNRVTVYIDKDGSEYHQIL